MQDKSYAFDKKQAEQLPPRRDYDHKVELVNDQMPPQAKPYRMSEYKTQKVKEYLEKNLSKGYIVPSKAAFSSPILFALKKNGDLRFCVDYRKLNHITRRNRYPLPLIEEVIGKIIGCKHLTRLDVIAAFNKIRIHKDSEDLTTFITTLGSYKYKVLPFGLTNGPASFQQFINDILFEHLGVFCQAYLDDILIYSKSRSEHRKHVRLVLDKLTAAGLQVDIEKCEFDVEETAFLGVIVSGEGLRMDPKKIEAILHWQTPTNLKQVQAFIGFANFYRRFIEGFSKTVAPLVRLTKKDTDFIWGVDCQHAFNVVKHRVTSAPCLRHFDSTKQAVLETDASDKVTGGVLSQKDDDGVLHPVAFYSKSMAPAEINYHIYDKELLAIIRCFEQWRPELENTDLPIQVFTDHEALLSFARKDSKELSRRQTRHAIFLADYNFDVIHRKGTANVKADSLSRIEHVDCHVADESMPQINPLAKLAQQQISALSIPQSYLYQRVLEANKTDELCEEYRQAVLSKEKKLHGTDLEDHRIDDGVLFKAHRVWVPESMQPEVIRAVHDQPMTGHPGEKRTYEILKRYYYWKGSRAIIERFVRNCRDCARTKSSKDARHGLLNPLSIPEQRWQDIAMDFVTGLPQSDDSNAICTIIDRLSKERHYVPCYWGNEGTNVDEVVSILVWNVIRLHGLPSSITSDRDPRFISTVWQSLCKRLGIASKLSTAYHPETDGQTERANQDCERGLRTYTNYMQDDWKKWLPLVEFADNNNTSASSHQTPFYLNKGFHPRMDFSPDDTTYDTVKKRVDSGRAQDIAEHMERLLVDAKARLQDSQERMKKQADRKRKDKSYEIGDWVWLNSRNIETARKCKKLEDKWLGPYQIRRLHHAGTAYELRLPVSMRIFPIFAPCELKPAANDPLPGQRVPPPKAVIVDGNEEWELDRILDSRRTRGGRLQYRVQWNGWDRDDAWYNADGDEFTHAKDLQDEFHSAYPHKPR